MWCKFKIDEITYSKYSAEQRILRTLPKMRFQYILKVFHTSNAKIFGDVF